MERAFHVGRVKGRAAPTGRRLGVAATLIWIAPALGASSAAGAGFDLDMFKPAPTAAGYFSEENARMLPDGAFDLEIAFGYMRQPLVLRDQIAGRPEGNVVADRFTGYVTALSGIAGRIELGFRAPVVLTQSGDVYVDISDGGGLPLRPRAPAPGDLDLLLRMRLAGGDTPEGYCLMLIAPFGFPTGAREALAGSGKVSFRPRVVAGRESSRLSLAASVGYELRRSSEIPSSNVVVGNALAAGGGFAYAAARDRLWLLGEISTLVGLSQSSSGSGPIPAEVLGGARVRLPGQILLQAGAGAGLGHAVGSPRFRALITLAYVYAPPIPPLSRDAPPSF